MNFNFFVFVRVDVQTYFTCKCQIAKLSDVEVSALYKCFLYFIFLYQVLTNQGSAYDAALGLVTIPISGVYYFTVTTVSESPDYSSNVDINYEKHLKAPSMLCR